MDETCIPLPGATRDDEHPTRSGRALRLAIVTVVAVLLVPRMAAQDAGGSEPAAATPATEAPNAASAGTTGADGVKPVDDPRKRTARRLLHGAHGGVLRATSRWTGEQWEHQRDGRWETLPPGAIDSYRLESEVLSESRKRRGAVRRNDVSALASHACWLMTEGLYEEGLNTASEVLEDAPDQPELLALLSSGSLPIGLPSLAVPEEQRPAARARMLEFGAAAPRSLQEMVIGALRDACAEPAEAEALRAELDVLLTDPSAPARAFAALALRRLVPSGSISQAEVEECLRRALRDVSPTVRSQASYFLRDVGEEGVILPAVMALESPSQGLRRHAAESLGLMGYSAAVPPLVTRLLTLPLNGSSGGYHAPSGHIFVGRQIAYVAGFNVDVAQNAAIGDPEIGTLQEGASVGVSVLGVNDAATEAYLAESKALRTALTQLTGADPGSSKKAWKGWWAKNQDRWDGTAATSGAGPDTPTAEAPAAPKSPR